MVIQIYLTDTFTGEVGENFDVNLTADLYVCNAKIDSGYDFLRAMREITAFFDTEEDFRKAKEMLDRKYPALKYQC